MRGIMNRRELILAALASAGGKKFTPVQIQKLLFLIDQRIAAQIGGPFFAFRPYDYGPFDEAVYAEIEFLASNNMVEILKDDNLRWKKYRPTADGLRRGNEILSRLEPSIARYITSLSEYIMRLSFAQLVSAIYAAYPDMKRNSVFQG